jgi:hypothetical protein
MALWTFDVIRFVAHLQLRLPGQLLAAVGHARESQELKREQKGK